LIILSLFKQYETCRNEGAIMLLESYYHYFSNINNRFLSFARKNELLKV